MRRPAIQHQELRLTEQGGPPARRAPAGRPTCGDHLVEQLHLEPDGADRLPRRARSAHRRLHRCVTLPPSPTRCSAADRSSWPACSAFASAWTSSWFFVLFLIIWQLSGYYKDLFPGEDRQGVHAGRGQRAALLPLDPAARARPRVRGDPQRDRDLRHRPVDVRRRGEDGAGHGLAGGRVPGGVAGPLVTLAIALRVLRAGLRALGRGHARSPARASRPRHERRRGRGARLPALDQRAGARSST